MDLSTSEIRKQQQLIMNMENEFKRLLPKLKEFLNELKVEEMQLKSLNKPVQKKDNQKKPRSHLSIAEVLQGIQEDPVAQNIEVVNQEELDLNIWLPEVFTAEDSD